MTSPTIKGADRPQQDDFRERTVLVTGASGFLGSHLCAALADSGAVLHSASRLVRADTGLMRWHQTDLTDVESTRRLINATRPDFLFHLSGLVSAAPELQTVRNSFDSLLMSTVNVLTAATEAGGCRRIVVFGSMMEPEPGQTDVPPTSPYMAAKWAASACARMFHTLYQTPLVIVRPAVAYGPGQPMERLVPYVIRSLLAGEAPRLSNGFFTGDWTYVDDMTDGIVAVARTPSIDGLTIDLGTGKATSARTVVELIVELMGSKIQPNFGALPDRPADRSRPADVDFTRSKIGWIARTSLREGLLRTISWLKEQPF
jgi:nucleoside-diphosphate-sugar epimerase